MVTQQIHLSDEANLKIRQLKGIYDFKNISQVVEKVVMEVDASGMQDMRDDNCD